MGRLFSHNKKKIVAGAVGRGSNS